MDSCALETDSHGKRIMCHERGNPETEVGRSLNDEGQRDDR